MFKAIKEIFRDIGESNFFLKMFFLMYTLQTAFGIEKSEKNLLLNEFIVWILIPFLFFVAFVKSKLLVKNYLPPEIIHYFLFILLMLATYPLVTDSALFVVVLRKLFMSLMMFIIVDYAIKSNLKAINIIFLSVLIGSLILCIINYQRIATTDVVFAHSDDTDELLALTDTETRINSNGLSSLAVNGVMGALFLLGTYKKARILILASLPVFVIVVVAAASKSGFLNLISILSLWYILCVSGNSKNKGLYLIIFSIFVCIFYFFIDDLLRGTFLLARFAEVDKTYYREDARGQLIQAGLDIFMNHPLFGVGLGQLATYTRAYSHNDYVEILSNSGIVGAIIYFSIYVVLLKRIQLLLKINTLNSKEIYNLRFCKALIITLLIRGMSLPSFSQFNEMFLIGVTVSYSFYIEKKYRIRKTLSHFVQQINL